MRILLGVEAFKILNHPMHSKIYKASKKFFNKFYQASAMHS